MDKLTRKCPRCKTTYEFKKEDVKKEKPMSLIKDDDLVFSFKCPICEAVEEIDKNPLILP